MKKGPFAIQGAVMISISVLVLGSCLPRDTRPVPGSLTVMLAADELLLGGVRSTTTTDGWTVSFDKFLVSLGNAELDGDVCASYSNGDYRRIFNLRIPGPQKVSIAYAAGQCDFGFRVSGPRSDTPLGPDPDTLLGEGVTEADRALMAAPGDDLHVTGRGIALYVKGRATKDATTKTFAWAFRQGIRFEQCGASGDAGVRGFDLKSGEALTTNLTVHGETLFLDSTEPKDAAPRFDIIAAADDKYGNADGEVTEGELASVRLADIWLDNRYVETDVPDAGASTLEAYIYTGLFPKVVRFEDDGTCTPRVRGGGR